MAVRQDVGFPCRVSGYPTEKPDTTCPNGSNNLRLICRVCRVYLRGESSAESNRGRFEALNRYFADLIGLE